jgi:hypothetical protein
MEEKENRQRDEIFSAVVRAGKRTYFFDVKETRAGSLYLTITESRRYFSDEENKFYYKKHKIFLYKEDFDKFADGYTQAVEYIKSNQEQEPEETNVNPEQNKFSDVKFEDLDPKDKTDTEPNGNK